MSKNKDAADPKTTVEEKVDGDPISQLQKLVRSMSPEDRYKLEQAGVVLPAGDLAQLRSGKHKFGVRCTMCNKVALYFVGDKWVVGEPENEIEVDEPPPLPHFRISWTQDLPPHEIDRSAPKCQHCRSLLPLNGDGSFSRERGRIVEIARWQESCAIHNNMKQVRKVFREVTKETGAYSAEMSANYTMPDEKASATITRQRGPEAVRELEQLAQMTGAAEALANGFKS